MPLNNSHSVIDKPESVKRVRPPTIIIVKTRAKLKKSQYINTSSIMANRSLCVKVRRHVALE